MTTLYDIKSEYDLILQQVNEYASEHDGEVSDELSNLLDSLVDSMEAKLTNCGLAYKNMMAESEMVAAEVKRLQKKKQSLESQAEWLKKYLTTCLNVGIKFKVPTVSLSWRPSVETVIEDESLIPENFFKIKREVSKTLVKEAIKEGKEVPGACLRQKDNLIIQ